MEYRYKGSLHRRLLPEVIEKSRTTALIIIKDDEIIYEQYANVYDEVSFSTSFSIAKALVSLFIGMAIEDGYLSSDFEALLCSV